MARYALQARYVFPIDQPPLADGVLTIEDERIVAVGQNTSGHAPFDLGNVALLPGLINAHTHLELSNVAAPLGTAGMPLPMWITHVVAHRREQSAAQAMAAPSAIVQGLRESLRCGTTTVGDIVQPGWLPREIESVRIEGFAFLELLGLGAQRIEPLTALAREHLARPTSPHCDWSLGLSPHAPYSVHPELLSAATGLLPGDGAVAMHLAESREELELLQTGGGPFAKMLQKFGVWNPEVFRQRRRPLDYLQILSQAPRALVVHGNYLDTEELQFLAAQRERMALVYCPRTHAYFGHERYPLARALELGIRVAVGTDSRASSPDLSLLAELRHIAEYHAELPLAEVLRLGTQSGALALGRAQRGTLTPGAYANLTAVALPENEQRPHELLLHHAGEVVQTWYRGVAALPESGAL